jgi:hypothetical protein
MWWVAALSVKNPRLPAPDVPLAVVEPCDDVEQRLREHRTFEAPSRSTPLGHSMSSAVAMILVTGSFVQQIMGMIVQPAEP